MTTLVEAYKQEAAAYGSNTLDTLYKLFKPIQGAPQIFDLKTDVDPIRHLSHATSYPTLEKGNNPLGGWLGKGYLINALPFYLMFGKFAADGGGAGVDRISSFDMGTEKMRISLYQALTDNSITDKYEAFGCVANNLALEWTPGDCLMGSLAGEGQNHGISSATPTVSGYPSDIATMYTTLNTLTWNSAAFAEVYGIKLEFQQPTTPYLDVDTNVGKYGDINAQHPILGVITIMARSHATVTSALKTDKAAGTTRTLRAKFVKADATKYVDCTFASSLCIGYQATAKLGDRVDIVAQFLTSSYQIDKVDGVADAFYTVS